MTQIKHRFTGVVLHEGPGTLQEEFQKAIASGVNLIGANLSCAYLSCANLSCANLSGADLSRANLSGAYLSGANLSGAYLSRANLSGADLSRANLSGADLSRAENILCLPVGDPRPYRPVAVWTDTEWMVYSGCRRFTIAEARAHWGVGYIGERSIGDQYVAAMDWLEAQLVPQPKPEN